MALRVSDRACNFRSRAGFNRAHLVPSCFGHRLRRGPITSSVQFNLDLLCASVLCLWYQRGDKHGADQACHAERGEGRGDSHEVYHILEAFGHQKSQRPIAYRSGATGHALRVAGEELVDHHAWYGTETEAVNRDEYREREQRDPEDAREVVRNLQ